MSALLLPLKPDVAQSPNSLHLGIVAAYMTFPDDEKNRNRAIERSRAHHYFEQFEAGMFPADKTGALIALALRSISIDDLNEISKEPHSRGYAAGMVLYNALLKNERGEAAPKTTALNEVAAALLQSRGNLKSDQATRTSSQPNKIIWESFRSVASFWAAMIMMGGDDEKTREFPCDRADLPTFLKWSEEFLRIGTTTKLPHRSEMMLDHTKCWRLPDDVVTSLPVGQIVLEGRTQPGS
jgi:hypothetical protein